MSTISVFRFTFWWKELLNTNRISKKGAKNNNLLETAFHHLKKKIVIPDLEPKIIDVLLYIYSICNTHKSYQYAYKPATAGYWSNEFLFSKSFRGTEAQFSLVWRMFCKATLQYLLPTLFNVNMFMQLIHVLLHLI